MCLWANSVIDEINGRINQRLRSSAEPSRLRIARCLYGLEGSNTVPFPQRRSWWRTPTAAPSRSASPWCLCRSQCHLASICSTSPGGDKEEFFFSSSSFLTLKASCSSNCMELKATKALTFAWTCCTGVAGPPSFSLSHIVAHHYLPPDTHVSKPFLSSQKKKRKEICLIACSTRHRGSAANGNPAYRWKSSFSHYCFFIRTLITWKWA